MTATAERTAFDLVWALKERVCVPVEENARTQWDQLLPGMTMDKVREIAFELGLGDQGLPDGSVISADDYLRYNQDFDETKSGKWLYLITPPSAGCYQIFVAIDFELNQKVHIT